MKLGRILTGLATTIAVLAIIASDHYWTNGFLSVALLSAVAFTAALELCRILAATGMRTFSRATAFASFVVALLPAVVIRWFPGMSPFAPQAGVIFGFVVLTFIFAMRSEDFAAGAKAVVAGTFVLVYVGLALSFFVRLRDFPSFGETFLLFAIGCAKVGDMGAYFAGRSFGRTPLAPRLSPKKTVEGAAGALVGSLVVAAILYPYLAAELAKHPELQITMSFARFAGCALVLSVAGQFGDLSESLLKRAAGVKDSSIVFSQMGGVLDVVDSLLLSAPVAYILALLGGFRAVQG